MKKTTPSARGLLVAFAVLFAGLAILSLFFIQGQSRNTRILFEYETDRTAAEILDAFRATGAIDTSTFGSDILAFAIYSPSGEAVAAYGTVPATLPQTDILPAFRYAAEDGTLTLVRALGARDTGMMGGGKQSLGMMRGGGRSMGPGGGTMLLRVRAGAWYGRQRLYVAGTILVPLILAAMGVAFFALFRSNLRYRAAAGERERLALLGESARTLAHEIRNPLGSIRMQTGLLRRSGAAGPELAIIDEEVERLNTLARRVGDILKNPAGEPALLNLSEFLRELVARTPGAARLDEEEGPMMVRFDPALLRSVVENLLRNSWESVEGTDAARGPDAVEISLRREGQRVVVVVRDRGPGIPPELAERVFDPFFTSKTRGSGLGLALARRFVEAAGGKLSLGPREGEGTDARIELPSREPP